MSINNKKLYKWIRVAFTILLVVFLVFATVKLSTKAYDFGYRVFTEAPMAERPGENVEVTIELGMSASDIGELLKKKGLVRDADLFVVQYTLSAYSGEIKAGTYILNTSQTAKEMMIIMADQVED